MTGGQPQQSAGTQEAKPGFWRSLVAVAWSFLGIRKDSAFKQDTATLKPLQLMAVGLGAVFFLVIGLMVVVKVLVPWVARH